MAVLQRAFFSGAKVQNKPAAAVAVCRRGGATAAYQTLNMIFEMMNMPVVTSQYWNIAYGLAPGEATQDTEGMQTMRTLADNMAWLLKKIHADGHILVGGFHGGDMGERTDFTPHLLRFPHCP